MCSSENVSHNNNTSWHKASPQHVTNYCKVINDNLCYINISDVLWLCTNCNCLLTFTICSGFMTARSSVVWQSVLVSGR